jgi:hypothetical protein
MENEMNSESPIYVVRVSSGEYYGISLYAIAEAESREEAEANVVAKFPGEWESSEQIDNLVTIMADAEITFDENGVSGLLGSGW